MNKKRLIILICTAVIVILAFLAPVILNSLYWVHVLILSFIAVLIASSFRALARTGQISLGTSGFMLLGAFCSALLMINLKISFWMALISGGAFAALVSLIVGYPFLRIKGIYFSILTMMLQEVCRLIAWYRFGSSGLRNIPVPDPIILFGLTVNFDSRIAYFYLVLVVVIISLVILYRIEHSWLGLIWSSIDEADILSQSVGINIMRHKMFIFAASSFFMGIAGSLYAHYMGTLTASAIPGSPFGFSASVYTVIYTVIGGISSFAGPIIGATIFSMIPQVFRSMQEYVPLLFGGLLMFVIFVMPGGITGLPAQLSRLFKRQDKNLKTPEVK
jgi:branched-chain amino acid transport system permease protein